MALLRYLVRLIPSPSVSYTSLRSIAGSLGVELRNLKRTSYGALEFDAFARSASDMDLFVAAVEPLSTVEFVKDLNLPAPHRTDEQLVEQARELFNRERYWESHEVLEALWRRLSGPEKSFVQGLILVCAAFVHSQKGEMEVALGVLRRAERQLSWREPSYHSIDVASLRKEVGSILQTGRFHSFTI
jgi:hypothetical protein